MKWILFFQTPYDRVKYITDELEDFDSLSYSKFISFLFSHTIIKDTLLLKEKIDSFRTIFLDLETGIWKIETKQTDPADLTFTNLLKLNPVENTETTNQLDNVINSRKEQFNKIIDQRRKENGILDKYR